MGSEMCIRDRYFPFIFPDIGMLSIPDIFALCRISKSLEFFPVLSWKTQQENLEKHLFIRTIKTALMRVLPVSVVV